MPFRQIRANEGCVRHLGSQPLSYHFLSVLGASDFLALDSHEPKDDPLGPTGQKIMIMMPFIVCFPQMGLTLPII